MPSAKCPFTKQELIRSSQGNAARESPWAWGLTICSQRDPNDSPAWLKVSSGNKGERMENSEYRLQKLQGEEGGIGLPEREEAGRRDDRPADAEREMEPQN
jgi:hypothetical protein